MNDPRHERVLRALDALLFDDSLETLRDIRAALEAEGVNVEGFLERLRILTDYSNPAITCSRCKEGCAEEPHTCPFSVAIRGDTYSLCRCCTSCTQNCAYSI